MDELVKELRERTVDFAVNYPLQSSPASIRKGQNSDPLCNKAANIIESIAPLVTALEALEDTLGYLTGRSGLYEKNIDPIIPGQIGLCYKKAKEALSAFKAKMEGFK